MKQKDVQVGKVYAVRVSGNLSPVRLVRERESTYKANRYASTGRLSHGGWDAVNLKTGRKVHIASAARLRFELEQRGGSKWFPINQLPQTSVEVR